VRLYAVLLQLAWRFLLWLPVVWFEHKEAPMIDLHVVNRRWLCVVALVLAALLVSGVAVTAQGPQPQGVQAALGPGFTYQGQLKNLGGAINGTCNMQFSLWDAQSNGTQVGVPHTIPGVTVSNGLFTVFVNSGGL